MNLKTDSLLIFGEKSISTLIVLFLFAGAFLLVYDKILTIVHCPKENDRMNALIEIISKNLLLLMIIEILVSVKISIKERKVSSVSFFIVGLIASIRRILIISVETVYEHTNFCQYMIEIGVLVGLSIIFVIAIVLLRKNKKT